MRGLFPAIQPNRCEFFDRDNGHRIYVEESGNPDGIPVVYCHGGPGGGSHGVHRRFYDPEIYRIVLFDQRGCGKSTPHAGLSHNDTWALVADMEYIRERLNIDKWVVTGGSWGSTLSMVYAINHPERVMGLILRGIFLARKQDYDWLYNPDGGAAQLFPDYYEDFRAPVAAKTEPVLPAYHKLLTSENEIERLHAAKCWATWEGRISTLKTHPDAHIRCSETHTALSLARLECHYFVNHCFMEVGYIVDNIQVIKDIPGFIIHGRYDVVCKLENAHTLDKHWPNGQLQVVPAAGHSGLEAPMADALCKASDAMADFVNKQEQG